VSAEPTPTSTFDLSFPHSWQAEILAARPLILPPRHFVYPREAEEVERGALEVLVRPFSTEHAAETRRDLKGHGFSRVGNAAREMPALATEGMQEPKAFRQGLKPQTPLGGPVGAAEAAPFQIGERDPAGVPSVTTRAQFERFPQEPFLARAHWDSAMRRCLRGSGLALIRKRCAPSPAAMRTSSIPARRSGSR